MDALLKNMKVLGGIVALVGGLTAFGVYKPGEEGKTAMTALVAVCGAGAVAAVVAKVTKKDQAPPSV